MATPVLTPTRWLTGRGLEDICRLCAIESESCMSIYSAEGENLSLEQKIMTCLQIKVSPNDLLPKKVCATCNTLLEDLNQFSCRAANAQQTLNFLIDLQLRQLQEQQIDILQGVKLEGNLIKNELDEVNIHHADLRVGTNRHSEPPDINFSHLDVMPEEYDMGCQTPLPIYRPTLPGKNKDGVTDGFSMSNTDQESPLSVVESDEPRQSHRRKMYQPKKAAERQGRELESTIDEIPLSGECLVDSTSNDVQCLMDSSTGVGEASRELHCLLNPRGQAEDNCGRVNCQIDATVQGEDSGEVHCILDSGTPQINDGSDVQCLMDSAVTAIEVSETQDDFRTVPFDEEELFGDLEDEEVNVERPESKTPAPNHLALVRDWEISCDKCNEVFAWRAEFDGHYKDTHGEKPVYTCSMCGKKSVKFSSFRSHCYRRHDSTFPCSYCDKVFTVEGMVRMHVLSMHMTDRPFICEKCGNGYVTQSRLNRHQKNHLEEPKEFRCNQCNKVMQTKNGLKSHMTAHKFGRRFMCDLCGKTFTQKVNMMQHVKFHKGERPFPCDQCNRRFAEKSHLNRHKSFHSKERPFQCQVCQKTYKTERCLKVHSQVHLDTRPYVCSDCGKGFLNASKLKEHYHCHTGERPYACKYCERTFTNFPNWMKHTRKRHKVDHKTGMRLLKEEGTQPIEPLLPLTDLGYLELPDVKVKMDGGDVTALLPIDSPQSILTQIHVAADLANFQLSDHQLLQYQDHSHLLPH